MIFVLAGCSQPKNYPQGAKLRAGYWISCVAVKKGMYHCMIFTRWRKNLVVDKYFIYPFLYNNIIDSDLSSKITNYDGDTVTFEDNRKLIATDMPKDAVRMQGLKDGVWVSCTPAKDKKGIYVCIVYEIKGKNILSSGEYELKRYYWDVKARRSVYFPVKDNITNLELIYYGGIGITARDKMVLLPHGVVDYPDPSGARGGIRIKYDSQANVIKQEDY
jgi:hypothetical protein